MKCVIVEDEKIQALMLEKLLKEEGIEVLAVENDAEVAIKSIDALRPDVVFLDINLGAYDGFYVIEKLSYKPYVVFTTAYSEYAIKAFEENAIDYILKPISRERLKKTLERLERLDQIATVEDNETKRGNQNGKIERIINQVRSESSLSYRSKILIESDDEINFVNFDDIIYIMSNNAITCVITNKEKHNTKETLKEYEKKLPNDKFLRVHKSYIVSIDHIRKVLKNYLGSTSLMMDNDDIIPVGRVYKDNLKKILQ
ncbi:MAG TPA: LytTR family DNA-binding domain-containing protein [Fervidobacterium sp.]|nr:LytTR family DNA-binding domain-containing protein [Fervidobacterium sp.]